MSDVIALDPGLVDRNAVINGKDSRPPHDATALPSPSLTPCLSGSIYEGVNQVVAEVMPGSQGTITVSFALVVPSILAVTFDAYRDTVTRLLGAGEDADIAIAAGIRPPPPPAASRMADYSLLLLQRLAPIPRGVVQPVGGRRFSTADCADDHACSAIQAIRDLPVARLEFRGTLTVGTGSATQSSAVGTVPVTVVVFDDGYTVPFAGYSDSLALDLGPTPTPVAVPDACWAVAD